MCWWMMFGVGRGGEGKERVGGVVRTLVVVGACGEGVGGGGEAVGWGRGGVAVEMAGGGMLADGGRRVLAVRMVLGERVRLGHR